MASKITVVQDLVNPCCLPAKALNNPSYHIAVVLNKSKIISIASNRLGNRSCGSGFSTHTIHAEIQALKYLGNLRRLQGSTMYVFRQNKAGKPLNSQPCAECHRILTMCMARWGLRKVYYST